MKKILFICLVLGLSSKSSDNADSHTKKTTFGKVDKSVNLSKIDGNVNFKNFFKNFSKKNNLKVVGKNNLGYSTSNCIYIFDVKSNKTISLSLSNMNRTDKIQCFYFDSKYIYVKFRRYIRIFDINGKEISNYNFTTKEVSGMDLFVNENHFYLVTHNKEIFAFRFDEKMKNINLIFFNNDFYSTRSGKFNLVIGDDIYILINRRFSVVHRNSGKILKNIILDISFDNLLLLKNTVFLYSKNRFGKVDLKELMVIYSDQIDLFGKKLIIAGSHIKFDNKLYSGNYIYTYFFKNIFFRYAQNTYDSHCFLIKNGKVFDFILQNFVINHIFNLSSGLALIDIKNKKIKLI